MLKIIHLKVLVLFIFTLLSNLVEAAIAVDDQFTVNENSSAQIIDIFENDTINKGEEITTFTQPTNGVAILEPFGMTYQPNNGYCNNGITTDNFTYTLTGNSTATVSVTVTCLAGSPVAQIIPVNQFQWLLFLLIAMILVVKFRTTT